MSQNISKIAFKKKLPVAKVKKPVVKQANQMRLITNAKGDILDVNDAFAATLGIAPLDLKQRNLLDTVLFKDFDDLTDDRALFNNLSHGENTGLSNLRTGTHVLLIGKAHDPHEFHFDWVKGANGQKYLVASSTTGDDQPNWVELLSTLSTHTDAQNNDHERNKPSVQDDAIAEDPAQPAPEKQPQIIRHPITEDDLSVFADINRNVQCVMDTDGTILRHNDILAEKMHGTDISTLLHLVHEDDRALARHYLQSIQDEYDNEVEFDHVKFETRMNTPEDKPLWMHWRIHVKGEELYAVGYDVTPAKMIELSLTRREQELSEAQALARMGHWRWSVGAETLEWSDQIYKIFGVNPNDFTPTLDNTNALIHKRDIGHMMQAFQRAIIEQNDYDVDFRVTHADGSTRYVQCEGRCELDADGDVIALYGVMQDMTAQAEHEMELRAAKDSAEQAYASKSRFLANMSHELRTPLNAIIGFSDMMTRQMLGPLGNDKYLEYAHNVKDSGEHLLSLITDILDMSKIEAGKYDLDIEDIQLGSVVNTAMRMIESRAQEGVITLTSKIKTDDPVIKADRRAVMQILLNILSNAVKFTEPGGEITLSIEEYDNHVTVKIADNGIGIPANKLSAVLKPFEQVSAAHTRNHEGSGLGLAITKELAELHGGTIILESTVGQGTTALIKLPKNARAKQK